MKKVLLVNQPEFIIRNVSKIFTDLSLLILDEEFSYSKEFCDSYPIINLKRENLASIKKKGHWDFIIATNEKEIPTAVEVSTILETHGPASKKNLGFFYNKFQMRKTLSDLGENSTQFFLFSNKKSNIDQEKPFIFKPISGTSSEGVFKSSFKELNASRIRSTSDTLVEEFIPGPEYSIEAITLNGNTKVYGVCQTKTSFKKSFVESSHLSGPLLNTNQLNLIENKLNRIFNHIEFNWGISHIEIKIYKDEIHFIEFHPRPAGGYIPQIVNKAWDNDFLQILKKLWSLDQDLKINQTAKNYSLVQFFNDLTKKEYEKLREYPFVSGGFYKEKVIQKVQSSQDRTSSIIVDGDSRLDLKDKIFILNKQFKTSKFDHYELLD